MCTRVAENRYIHAHAVREAHPAWVFGSLKPIILRISVRATVATSKLIISRYYEIGDFFP